MEAECLRLRGELVLCGDAPDPAAAERSFGEALAVAERQGARSWQLRAAISLARLLQERDKRGEALALLEPVLESFEEGRETAGLPQGPSASGISKLVDKASPRRSVDARRRLLQAPVEQKRAAR